MIKIFEKTIREHLTGHWTESDFPLSYIKFSTVTSGRGLNDKVIFLVFKNGASLPFLCIKTVRNNEAKEAVLRNFNNLKRLNTLTAGSKYARLFAEALYLYDDGKNIFCIESACLGKKINLDKERLGAVVTEYIDFQEYLAKQDSGSLRDIEQLAKETIAKSGLNEPNQQKLLEYIAKLPLSKIKLPRIIQHGDLTPDNLLLSSNGLCIVDYDYVGNSDIPGFDLFGLFHRFSPADLLKLCEEYFPTYFEKIGGQSVRSDYRRLIFLHHLIEHIQGSPSNYKAVLPEKIISDFEHLYP